MDITRGGGYLQRNQKSITYTGAAGAGLAASPVTIFTVTGEILVVAIVPFCTTLLTESGATATIALGITGSTSLFVAATDAVEIDANEFWIDATPDAAGVALPAGLKDIVITADIINTIAVANVNAGVIRYSLYWMPLSDDAAVS